MFFICSSLQFYKGDSSSKYVELVKDYRYVSNLCKCSRIDKIFVIGPTVYTMEAILTDADIVPEDDWKRKVIFSNQPNLDMLHLEVTNNESTSLQSEQATMQSLFTGWVVSKAISSYVLNTYVDNPLESMKVKRIIVVANDHYNIMPLDHIIDVMTTVSLYGPLWSLTTRYAYGVPVPIASFMTLENSNPNVNNIAAHLLITFCDQYQKKHGSLRDLLIAATDRYGYINAAMFELSFQRYLQIKGFIHKPMSPWTNSLFSVDWITRTPNTTASVTYSIDDVLRHPLHTMWDRYVVQGCPVLPKGVPEVIGTSGYLLGQLLSGRI